MQYQHWLRAARARLADSESPRREAEILLEQVTGRPRTWLIAFGETELTPTQLTQLDALLARRLRGEPIAWLTGEREFWSLPLRVSPATLIPRPDTECLVERALAWLPAQPCRILDLGTGTGAIALALACERPDCRITAVDVIADAVTLARENAARLGLTNVRIQQSDWFSALDPTHRFTLIVSNPPYIDAADPHLQQGDVRFEPASALVAAQHGLADLRAIIDAAPHWLEPGGSLLLEHGWQQGEAVRHALRRAGFYAVSTTRDYGGRERVSGGVYPLSPPAPAAE